MAPKPTQQQLAKDLYLQTEKTQQEIADILNVNRRTIYLWVKNGKWAEMKNAAAQTPFTMQSEIHNHFSAINRRIKAREGDNCPTMQEVEMLRKLLNMSATIDKLHTGAYIEAFTELTTYIYHKDVDLARKVTIHADNYVKGHLGDDNDEYKRHIAENIARVEKNLENEPEQEDPTFTPDSITEPPLTDQDQTESPQSIEPTPPQPATQIITPNENNTLSSIPVSTSLNKTRVGNNTLSLGEGRGEVNEGRVGNNTLSSGEGRGEVNKSRVGDNTLSLGSQSRFFIGKGRGEVNEGRVGNNTLSSGEGRGEVNEAQVGNNTLSSVPVSTSTNNGRGEANEIKCDNNGITPAPHNDSDKQLINNELNQQATTTPYPITNFSNNGTTTPQWQNRSFIDHPANEVLGKG